MKTKKLTLKTKTLLSLGIISALSISAIGGMFAYAKNSDEVNGSYSHLSPLDLKNDFSSIRDTNGNLKPQISILDPSKKNIIGKIDSSYTMFSFANDPSSKFYDFNEFFKKYFEIYNESFVLEVKYGSFSFFDEYVLAVHPKQFIEFTKWFIDNVAWGPDLVTLESFRIVPGVEQNGNAITLGSHSTVHKESSEIKFFPDAFFGSLPIYSSQAGAGNATDSLTYSLFEKQISKASVDDFLASIPTATAVKNAKSRGGGSVFLSLILPKRLIGTEFLVLKNKPFDANTDYEQLKKEKDRGKGTFVLPKGTTKAQFEKYLDENKLDKKSYKFNDFKLATVSNVIVNEEKNSINVEFKFKDNSIHSYEMLQGEVDPLWYSAYNAYKSILDQKIINFLDFYDVEAYKTIADGKENKIWVYSSNGQNRFFRSKIEALNSIPEFKNYEKTSLTEKDKLSEYQIEELKVKNNFLLAKLKAVSSTNKKSKTLSFSFDANNMTQKNLDLFNEFKFALGYQGAINPITIQASPEDITLKDENGKQIKGLASRKYQVFVETYDGLVEKVLAKYPYLAVKRNGPHIVKKLNSKFVYEYSIEDGEYYGLNDTDRIGLPLIIGASIPNFDGITTDFLKYVGAHEYGHHYTLDQNQALNENANAVIVGGLSTRGGLNESSYYSVEGLRNYLYARTNLDFVRVNALGRETINGSFAKFIFRKKDGKSERETATDIWGTNSNNRNNIYEVLDNPRRRFLQDFKGLENAAKLRNVNLGDLFIANSFDEESGTLNPFISGISKVFTKKQENGKETYGFTEVQAKKILDFVRDGKKQVWNDKALAIDPENPNLFLLSPVTFKGSGDKRIVESINMLNNDGSPIISVPLNTPLSHSDLAYVDKQVKIIRDAFSSVISRSVAESGWNGPSTTLGGRPKLGISAAFNTRNGEIIHNNLLYRSDQVEIDPSENNIIQSKRKAFEYTAIQSNVSLFYQVYNIYLASLPTLTGNRQYSNYSISQTNNTIAFVSGGQTNGKKTPFKIESTYTIPWVKDAIIPNSSYSVNQRYLNSLRGAGLNIDAAFQTTFSDNFVLGFTKIASNSNSLTSFIFLDENNERINPRLFTNITQNLDMLRNRFKKIALNPGRLSVNQKSLYSSYANGIGQEVSLNGTSKTIMPTFTTLDKLFEFTSIDYSKAKLVSVSTDEKGVQHPKFNWDINYVKTKFDFSKFRKEVAKEAGVDQKTKDLWNTSDQELANELMYRFRHSNHFAFAKDFNPAKSLVQNQAILSEDFGMNLYSKSFKNGFVFDLSQVKDPTEKRLKFDAEKLQEIFTDYVKEEFDGEPQTVIDKVINTLNTQDLYRLTGGLLWFDSHGQTDNGNLDILFPGFSAGEPSDDVLNYNLTRVEPLISDKFTDYIYNIAETLTRDYVQTTYVPNWNDFKGLPSFISGVSESRTGLDYIVDATSLDLWNDRVNKQADINSSVYSVVRARKYDKYLSESKETFFEFANKKHTYTDKIYEYSDIVKNGEKVETSDGKFIRKKITDKTKIERYENLIKRFEKIQEDELNKRNDKTGKIREKVYGEYNTESRRIMSSTETRISSYFGKLLSKNNGYFKDRFQKEKIGMQLYDDNANQIIDDSIRLKDFKGNKINSRPKAFFVSQLLNYGVGTRTVSGIFRNKNKDAVALYGYIPLELSKKVKAIKFTDLETGEAKYLDVNIAKTNNVFYLERQGDINTKKTVEDFGFTSWVSDFGIMGKYRDTLLKPRHSYTVEFVDEKKMYIADITLGKLEYLTENGKTSSQASIKLTKGVKSNDTKKEKTIISVDYQFNISG
ncbi:PDxFFG protein [Mycoplasmopsis cynos]|uniref:PDxFFG protein n=1 Tax=Mycoplasmopsis cynos TaxID=171284 RepID=UPI002AFEF756|nr:PDxFFG protein [Mycoplasmopsis cynos]WQQ16450.1 PDxFFG protein [Mycoplasmopsis cynos]